MGKEVVQRTARSLRDQHERLHRRLGLADLDKVNGSPAHGSVRDLSQAEPRFPAGLLHRPCLDLDAVAPSSPPAPAGDWGPARVSFIHCAPAYRTPRGIDTVGLTH